MASRQRLECKSPLLLFFLRRPVFALTYSRLTYGFAPALGSRKSPLLLFFLRRPVFALTYSRLTYGFAPALGVQKSPFAFLSTEACVRLNLFTPNLWLRASAWSAKVPFRFHIEELGVAKALSG